jgi:glycerol-3-phosphate dehydrogenase
MNLVTSRPARKAALAMPAKSGRALILLPWQGRTLVGTGESAVEQRADDQEARHLEVSRFLTEVNETFPGFNLNAAEVTLVHRGIVPAVKDARGLSLLGHSTVVDHAADGIANLVSVVGVKYTTARGVAERVTDLVLAKLGRPAVPCRTAETLLPTADLRDTAPANLIRQAVEVEMAQTLADVMVRRTGAGAAGYPGDGPVHEQAGAMQEMCGWSSERTSSEIAALKRFYDVL